MFLVQTSWNQKKIPGLPSAARGGRTSKDVSTETELERDRAGDGELLSEKVLTACLTAREKKNDFQHYRRTNINEYYFYA